MRHMRIALALLILLSLFFASVSAAGEDCRTIWADMDDITISENSTQYFNFTVYNDEEKDFDIYEVRAGKEAGFTNLSVSIVNFPDEIESGDEGTIRVKIITGNFGEDETIEANIEVRGRFIGGDTCGFDDTAENVFYITVEATGPVGDRCDDISVVTSNVTMDEDDIVFEAFAIENDSDERFYVDDIEASESSSYLDAGAYDNDDYANANDSADFTLRIESENVSSDRTETVTVRVRGHFAGGESCSYSETNDDSFTVTIENVGGAGGGDFTGGADCSDLRLSVSDVTVEKGKEATKNSVLENNANERFYIDYVNVYDSSSKFKAESDGYDKTVYADSIGTIGVKVSAYASAAIGREKAYISVRGHFQGGSTCRLRDNEKEFYVKVVEPEEEPYVVPALPKYSDYCSGFIFSAPSTKTIKQSSTIALRIENNTPYRATVRFYGEGLSIEPSLLSIPSGFKSDSYIISVFASKASSTLYYEIETFNCMTREHTSILSLEEEPEQPSSGQTNASEGAQGTTAGGGTLQAIAGTAFAALGTNAGLSGLLLIALLLIAYSFVIARQKRKTEKIIHK